MNALLDRARRAGRRAAGRFRRRLSGGEDGFVLLETIIAISLITVIMAAIGVEYVSGMAAVARQRDTQSAAQVADSTLEQIRALKPSDLVTGRGATSVQKQFTWGNALTSVSPWLQNMDQASDSAALPTDGANASIPTCDPDVVAQQNPTQAGHTANPSTCLQKPGSVSFTVAQFLGTCWLISSGSSSSCVPTAQKTAGAVQYLRAVVSVGWVNGTCTAGCYYVTSTLISTGTDPAFRANQPPAASPAISAPGNQVSDLGDTVALQLSLQTGTGIPGYKWEVTAGSLPSGLSLSASGLISGTTSTLTAPTSVTVRVTDGFGRQDTATFTWAVLSAPQITAPPNQTTSVNTAVSLQLTTSCVNTPCVYTLNNGPTGLSVSSTGLITGTPPLTGITTTSITVTDAANRTVTSNSFTWSVLAPATTCPTAVTLSNGSFETPYVGGASGLGVTNGTAGMVWTTNDINNQVEYWSNGGNSTSVNGGTAISAVDGNQWVEVNGAGMDTISQDVTTTPGQVVQWSLWHRARNATGNVNAQDSIQVQMGSTTRQTAQTPTGATSPTISDGAATWVQYTGSYTVPAGQTTTRFRVAATATSSGSSSVGNFVDAVTVTGVPCLFTAVPAQSSTVNTAISPFQLSANQGSGNFVWSGGNTLPAGLSLSASGLITGTPTATGTKQVTLVLTDTLSGYSESVSFTWTVFGGPSVTTPPSQTSSVGAADSLRVSASCPNSPCSYALSGKPPGLNIDSTGLISGSPTTAGVYGSVAVTVTDASGATATTSAFSWTVRAAPTIAAPGNSSIDVGTQISYPVSSTCANTPCSYSATGLPPGLTISSSTGAISGAPTTPGVYTVTATINDAAGATASTSPITLTIYARPTITSPGTQTSTVNTALILPISSTCPNTSCTYVLTGAPTGLIINSGTGRITGTPTATGTSSSAKVTVTDAGGVAVDTGTFTWNIVAGPSVTAPSNQTTVNNAAVNLTLTKTCPNAPCAYALNGGPAGLSISSAGVITGTVTSAPRTFSGVTITVTDSSGVTATSSGFTWTVTTPLVGRWAFDEASGTAVADSSPGNSHGATLAGSGYTRSSAAAQGAYAVNFSGGSAAATASGTVLDTSGSFTVGAWVRLNSTSTTQTFVSQDGTNVSAFALQYNMVAGKFVFSRTASDSSGAATTTVSATSAPTIGQWYYLTGVHDATADTLTLYVDGVQQGNPVAYSTGWNASGTGKFVMGRGKPNGVANNYANASIDDVRAYSSALSGDAVAPLSQSLYWPLDEGSGTAAKDSSPATVDGTLSSGASWTTGAVGPYAVQLNGSSGAVTGTGPAIDTNQSFTVSAWAKADSATANGTVASVDGTNVSAFTLGARSGRWTLGRPASDSTSATITYATATSTITAGQWYQLAAVYDSVGKTISLYVNGVRQGSAVAFTSGFKGASAFVVGRSKSGTSTNWFGGAVDEVTASQFAADQATVNSLTTLITPVPAAPTATAGAASATVSWTAPVNIAGSAVTGYVVTPYLDGVAQTAVTYSSTATSQTLTGLSTGQSYTFSVAATNANGTSAASPVSGSVLIS